MKDTPISAYALCFEQGHTIRHDSPERNVAGEVGARTRDRCIDVSYLGTPLKSRTGVMLLEGCARSSEINALT